MSTVLYRKYRAQNFDELIGQGHITQILKNAIKKDQLSHAYLFVGARGTGKTSAARIFAKAVNCTNIGKDGNPCSKCKICKGVAKGNFLDLIEIDAASNRGIDQIRELKEKIEFSPSEGKYKVYIIDEVHMLTTEAFNALLKTLEEPPSHIIFILATTEVHKLPATILSRCQRYDFRLGNDKEIEEVIDRSAKGEGMKVEDSAKYLIVKNARGSYRDALSLLDVIFCGQSGKDKKITEDEVRNLLGLPDIAMVDSLLSSLMDGDAKKALELIESIEGKGVNLGQFVSYTLETLREVLVAKIKDEELEYDFYDKVVQKDILKLVKIFLEIERNLKGSSNQSLILEMVIPEFCADAYIEEEEEEEEEEAVDNDVDIKGNDDSKPTVADSDKQIDFDVIKKNWGKVAQAVKPVHRHLFAFLGTSKPIKCEGSSLYIEVPFQFHKDQIDCPQSRDVINQVLKDMFNISCNLVCSVNEKAKPRMKGNADIVLKNIPTKESVNVATTNKKNFSRSGISAEVEAIFEGL
ncbi:DNA polymerase III subunit gamma/tau [bacterium]|nr:DNA polymerase III subunit gamma/tau [bacterium]